MLEYLYSLFPSEAKSAVKRYRKITLKINALEESISKMTQSEMKDLVLTLKKEVNAGEKSLNDVLPTAFALVRESARRTLNERHYDVQLIGGMVLFNRGIAEMRTGEGKTLTATLPTFLFALAGKGVHVVTVNDYLARRDAAWIGQVYDYLGLTVGVIGHEESYLYNSNFKSEIKEEVTDEKRDETGSFKVEYDFLERCTRKQSYDADITYGTNSEFGFDYLRDNLVYSESELSQREHFAAIVDESDSILIDESRTPLIISSAAGEDDAVYRNFAELAKHFKRDTDFLVEEKEKQVTLTEAGIEKAENYLGIHNIYSPGNTKLVHHLLNAVKARSIFNIDKEYVVKDGEVVIVDEFTGRLKHGTRWSEGLHQAVEAKEGVAIQKESRTIASITYQNYFRLYKNLAGMTGTGETSKEEFQKVYGLSVVPVPTHRQVKRIDRPDVVYQTEKAKWKAIVEKVKELSEKGQPVLIGTTSIEKNETLSKYFDRAGIKYEMLNAKNHEREGDIIAQAGKLGSIVVATNMAGRGVDIKLGGVPSKEEAKNAVKETGGLFVLGTERHEARRIDNQLRGRSGRQGDVGETQFFVSLEDEIMKRFGGDAMKRMMERLSVPEDMPLESKMVSKMIESSQKKIEGFYFDVRKQVLQYDAVLSSQRDSVYTKRRAILSGDLGLIKSSMDALIPLKDGLSEMVQNKIDELGEEVFYNGVKPVFLQSMDIHWMGHLDMMEHLRQSVSLRGYGQHDPLVEYKREGLRHFKEMQYAMEKTSADYLFYSLKSQEKGEMPYEEKPKLEDGKTIGRNDPCFCGSGKKFKKCHGA